MLRYWFPEEKLHEIVQEVQNYRTCTLVALPMSQEHMGGEVPLDDEMGTRHRDALFAIGKSQRAEIYFLGNFGIRWALYVF